MKTIARGATIALALSLVQCVPPTEELAPAGAAGFVTEPSPASRGEPIVTEDGWLLRFEELAIQAAVSASSADDGSSTTYATSLDVFRWNARDRVEIYTRALAVGRWYPRAYLFGAFIDLDDDDEGRIVDLGVDDTLRRRFAVRLDDSIFGGFMAGPMVVVRLRASRGDQAIVLDTALSTEMYDGLRDAREAPPVDVHADSLSSAPLAVRAERLFHDTERDGQHLRFARFAAADADGDGLLTIAELDATTAECPECLDPASAPPPFPFPGEEETEPDPTAAHTLLDVLRARLPRLVQRTE